jgi:hypothetical protein
VVSKLGNSWVNHMWGMHQVTSDCKYRLTFAKNICPRAVTQTRWSIVEYIILSGAGLRWITLFLRVDIINTWGATSDQENGLIRVTNLP